MKVTLVKTRTFLPPKDNLWELLTESVKSLNENSVVAVTSKVVSIGEGRCIPVSEVKAKDELIKSESDWYLPRKYVPKAWVMHTVTHSMFTPTAGIDESNSNGYYVLYPKDPAKSAREIWEFLRKKFNLKNLGVVITDSHTIPLRRGSLGISIAHWGFKSVEDYRGKTDIFGRKLKITMVNIPDSLACAAVFAMGEGDEKTPIAIIEDVPKVEFINHREHLNKPFSTFEVPMDEDLFKPFLTSVKWEKGGRGRK